MVRVARSRGGAGGLCARSQAGSALRAHGGRLPASAPVPLPGEERVSPTPAIPYQALDALPLAAEPFAAALDLALRGRDVRSDARRRSWSCSRSPHWRSWTMPSSLPTELSTRRPLRRSTRCSARSKYLGGWDRVRGLFRESDRADLRPHQAASGSGRSRRSARRDTGRARRFARRSRRRPPPRSSAACVAFIKRHERLPARGLPASRRTFAPAAPSSARCRAGRRARGPRRRAAAGDGAGEHGPALDRGADVLAAHRRRRRCTLLDARAAAYADLDDVRLVGLVESDWPERAPAQHLLPGVAARPARMAERRSIG